MKKINICFLAIALIAMGVGIHCGEPDLITQSDGEEDEEEGDNGASGSENDTNASGAASAHELEQMISGNTFYLESDNFREDFNEVCNAAEEEEDDYDEDDVPKTGSVNKKLPDLKNIEEGEAGTVTFDADGAFDFLGLDMHWKVVDEDTIKTSYGPDCEYWDMSIDGDVLTVSLPEEFDCMGDYCAEDYEWDS